MVAHTFTYMYATEPKRYLAFNDDVMIRSPGTVECGTMQPDASVSIVIVNWNRGEDVVRAVRHLRGLRGLDAEIVVVDNGSTDGSRVRLAGLESVRFVGL